MSDNEPSILNCGPKSPRGKISGDKWFLVPAYAWQVIISSRNNSRLNAFEKLIVRLLKNARYTKKQLVKMTHLDEDLIDRIQTDLKLQTDSKEQLYIEEICAYDLVIRNGVIVDGVINSGPLENGNIQYGIITNNTIQDGSVEDIVIKKGILKGGVLKTAEGVIDNAIIKTINIQISEPETPQKEVSGWI